MGHRLALVVLVACGGARVSGPQPDLDNMKMYEPFAMKADAKAPDHAVILGTDVKGGSTVLNIPAAPASVVVDAVAGEQVAIKLTTAPNADGAVHVGIFEDKVGDGGAQWRAGVWVAAIVAAHTLGKDLADFTFSASAGGVIDGPSASALIAAGFLATMTGAKIDPTVTLAGVINPDGTIGPVDGLAERLRAAKGKKKFGYPSGLRRGELVDLAAKHGTVLVELANVHDAYKLLTGKALPASIPMTAAEMAVEAATSTALAATYKAWQVELATKAAALAEITKASKLPAALSAMVTAANQASERAAALHARGVMGAAFVRIVAAWAYAAAATDTYAVLVKVRAGDLAGARTALGNLRQFDPTAALAKIAEIRPTTIGGHILMMGAFQSALRSAGFAHLAVWRLGLASEYLGTLEGKSKADLASAKVADELVAVLAPAELLVARSELDTKIAVQRLEFETAKSIGYMCSLPNVIRLATSYRSASTAGMSYLDSLLVDPLAAKEGISSDAARMRIVSAEPDYLVAYTLAHLDESGADLKATLGETSLAWNLMLLAGAERAYLDAAQLTMKHYAFDQNAMPLLLANAERAARTTARAAQIATGAIPVQARLAFQVASTFHNGDLAEKQEALTSYWAATAYSHAAVMLARN
jgi:hypothetical protein